MHLVVATPMFGGICHGQFAMSVQALIRAFAKAGWKLTTFYLGNESLIERARNALIWQFLNATPDAEFVLFADGTNPSAGRTSSA